MSCVIREALIAAVLVEIQNHHFFCYSHWVLSFKATGNTILAQATLVGIASGTRNLISMDFQSDAYC